MMPLRKPACICRVFMAGWRWSWVWRHAKGQGLNTGKLSGSSAWCKQWGESVRATSYWNITWPHLNTPSASGLRLQYTDDPATRATARSGGAPDIEVSDIRGKKQWGWTKQWDVRNKNGIKPIKLWCFVADITGHLDDHLYDYMIWACLKVDEDVVSTPKCAFQWESDPINHPILPYFAGVPESNL